MPLLEFKLKLPKTDTDNFVWKPVSAWITGDGAVTFNDDITGTITYNQSENETLNKRYGEILLYNNFKKFAVFKVAQRGKPYLSFNDTPVEYTLNISGDEHIYIVDGSSLNDSDPIICDIKMYNIVTEDNVHGNNMYHDDVYFDKSIFTSTSAYNWIRPLGYRSIINNYIDDDSELFSNPINNTIESETNIDYNNDEDTTDSFYTLHIEEEGFSYKLGFNVQRNLTGEPREITIDFYNRYPVLDEEYSKIVPKDIPADALFNNKKIGTLTIKQDPYIEFLIDSVETKSQNIRAVELNDYEYFEYVTDDSGNTELRKIEDNSYLGEINNEFNPVIKVYNGEITKTDSGLLTIEKSDDGILVRYLGIVVTENLDIQESDDKNTVTVSYTISEDNIITETLIINNEETTETFDIERTPNLIYHRTYKQLDNVLNYRVAGCFNQHIKLSTDADWVTIKNIDYSIGKIYYQVSENTSEDEREAIINVSFFGNNSTSFKIKQFGQPSLTFEQSGSNVLDYWVSKTGTSEIEGDVFLEYSLPIKEMKNIIPELLYSIDISIDINNEDPQYPNRQTVIEEIIGYETITPTNYKHDAGRTNDITVTYNPYTKFVALSSRKSSEGEHNISGEITIIEDDTEQTNINTIIPSDKEDANSYNICQHMCAVELPYYTELINDDNTVTHIPNVSDSLILTTNNNLTKNIIDETIKLIYNNRNIANINLKQYYFDFIFIDPIELNVDYNAHTYYLHYSSDNSNYLRFRLLNEESTIIPTIIYSNNNTISNISFYNITESKDNTIYAVKDFDHGKSTNNCQHNTTLSDDEFPYIIINIPENTDTSVHGWNIAVDCAPDDSFNNVITYVISIEQSGKLTMEILRNELNKCISFNKYVKKIEFGIYNVSGNDITMTKTNGINKVYLNNQPEQELLCCNITENHECIVENTYSIPESNKEFNTYSFRCVSTITIPENKNITSILHNFEYYCPLIKTESTEQIN